MKKVYRCFLVVVVTLGLSLGEAEAKFVHPFFVSVTEVNYNANTNSLEISCKMFVDDLQKVLRETFKRPVNLSNTKQEADNSKMLNEYISNHLSIGADNKQASLKFIGFEIERESVYCYFEADKIAAPKKIVLNNKIMLEYKDEQQNIMHVVIGGNRKSTKTDKQNQQAIINF
jgi:hypothetical protein